MDSNNILGFFLDNAAGGGQGEWSPGDIAALRVYNGVLTQDQVTALDNVTTATIPELATLLLLAGAVSGLAAFRRGRSAG